MKLELVFTAGDVKNTDIRGKVFVAFDVFRATSTIIAALENHCAAIIPAVSVEEAWAKRDELKNRNVGVLVAGERHGVKVEGMDLGNSPVEYMGADLYGKTVVLSTSNGTHAIRNAQAARKIFIGALLNAGPVARKLVKEKRDVVFGCAGRLGEFSLEDFIAAGAVTYFIRQMDPEIQAADSVLAAEACFAYSKNNLTAFLRGGKHGRYLERIGFEKDICFCTRLNIFEIVPEYREGSIKVW